MFALCAFLVCRTALSDDTQPGVTAEVGDYRTIENAAVAKIVPAAAARAPSPGKTPARGTARWERGREASGLRTTAESLDEEFVVGPQTTVSFIKLTPLVGG
jgi:hypothetical protein